MSRCSSSCCGGLWVCGLYCQKATSPLHPHLQGTLTYDEFNTVDMVIEAAVENINLKQQIFKGERHAGWV